MPHQDFAIDSLARYLHLTPQQVARLAEKGRLPGRKVGGQWRFPRAEIHHWLEGRIGLSDEEELIQVEGVLRRSGDSEEEAISIVEMLPEQAIAIPLPARTRNSVFSSIVEVAMQTGFLWDAEAMVEAIRSREDLYPTAMEGGVALLHPRRPMPAILGSAMLALGVTATGIPFGGARGGLTDVFFLICSVEDRGHLRTLARLARVIGTPGFLADLRQAPDAPTAHRLIRETEKKLSQ
jgi:PTS system nitrogen regulatory IIA component